VSMGLIDPHEENQDAIETALGPVSANERVRPCRSFRSKPITLKSAQFLVEAPGGEKMFWRMRSNTGGIADRR
jgi:hypothetical protein